MSLPVLAEVVRSGFVEGHHAGSMLALRADGSRAVWLGRPDSPIFPRSANKPLQAVAMLRAGLDLDGELLAVAAASHSGEAYHLDVVRRLLASADLEPGMLGNTPGLPLDEPSARAAVRAGLEPAPLMQNCSGKHAAMLATCVVNGWPLGSYLDPEHPLQRRIGADVEELAGEAVAATGVDGCGAPLHAVSLSALARAFRRLVTAAAGSPQRRVADAMRAYPFVVGGTGRAATRLMSGIPGLLAKDAAEGVVVVATAVGEVVAVKIDDGAQRAATPVAVAGLRALGYRAEVLDDLAEWPILGGGRRVGQVRPVIPTDTGPPEAPHPPRVRSLG